MKAIKEQQTQWQKLSKEKNLKNFTYDYDGSMLIILNNEKDKLPPIQQSIQYDLREIEKNSKKKKEPVKKASKAHKSNKQLENEKDPLNQVNLIPVDDFDLKPGVTLYYMGLSKKGNKPANTIDRLMNPDVRLTKTEYLELTKGGNLSRATIQVKTEREINTAFEPRPKEADFLSKAIKTDGFKDFSTSKKKAIDQTGTIRINSSKLINTLSEIGMKDHLTIPKEYKKPKKEKPQEETMDDIDKFNKEVLFSKDWGKTLSGSKKIKQNSVISKPSLRIIKSSVGIRLKMPRERVIESKRPSSYKKLAYPLPGQMIGTQFLPEISAVNESREKSFFN